MQKVGSFNIWQKHKNNYSLLLFDKINILMPYFY